MARDDYDSPWKEGLARYLGRFFEFFFPDIHQDVDWRVPPRFLDKELRAVAPSGVANQRAGPRVVDILVQLQRQTGEPTCVLVHIEVQAQKVRDFEKRLLLYHTRIMESRDKPVCSLVILADKNTNWRPNRYEHNLWHNRLQFEFPTCKLLDFKERLSTLEVSNNPFALITAATLHAQSTRQGSKRRDAAKWILVRRLYDSGLSKEEVLDFFRLIDWILRLSSEQERLFWQRLQQVEKETKMPYITSVERIGREKGLAEGREKGREKGLAEGRAEGLRLALIQILETRFAEIRPMLAQKLQTLSDLNQLQALSRLAVTVESLEAFETELDGDTRQPSAP